ncbi:MAG: zinc-ribbon domain containing protein [Armatimonadota bacterium]
MSYTDKSLNCRECGASFTFTAGEQEFHAQKGFTNLPGRCPDCRAQRRAQGGRRSSGPREMFDATCASCGNSCQVPFQPTGEKPVYCSDCFQSQRPPRNDRW